MSSREQIILVALYKRATMSESLWLLCKKEGHKWFDWKKLYLYLYYIFHFFSPRANGSIHSMLSRSFKKSKGSNLLLLLFSKEWPWANRSCCSLQKNNCEWFASIAHDKRAMWVICSFSWANRSCAHKKWAICLKNWWGNSQPWLKYEIFELGSYNTIICPNIESVKKISKSPYSGVN